MSHTCSVISCNNSSVIGGFCDDHKCKYPKCLRLKISVDACDYHTCYNGECSNIRYSKFTMCEECIMFYKQQIRDIPGIEKLSFDDDIDICSFEEFIYYGKEHCGCFGQDGEY